MQEILCFSVGNNKVNRPFNENNYSTLREKRPKTQQRHLDSQTVRLSSRLSTNRHIVKSTARSKMLDNLSETRSVHNSNRQRVLSSSRQEEYHKNKELNVNEYSTIENERKQHNQSVDIKRKLMGTDKQDIQNNEQFKEIEEKVLSKLTNKNDQQKALNRVDLLKRYLNSQNDEFLNKIKSKMTQELLHFNKAREHSVESSEVLRRLNESLKLKTDPVKAILYAKDYYDKLNNKIHSHVDMNNLNEDNHKKDILDHEMYINDDREQNLEEKSISEMDQILNSIILDQSNNQNEILNHNEESCISKKNQEIIAKLKEQLKKEKELRKQTEQAYENAVQQFKH